MDSEQKRMLEKLLELTEQNNKILRRMHRQALWSTFFRLIYWIVIIAIAVWSYNLIQPYIGTLTGLVGKAQQLQSSIPSFK